MKNEEALPITFLHSEPCESEVTECPETDFARERDTMIRSTGDSDTV